MLEHTGFLEYIKNYVTANPEVTPYVQEFVARGLTEALRETREMAADMEVALAVTMAKRYRGRDGIVVDKLQKWKDKSSLNWSSTLEMLEKGEKK